MTYGYWITSNVKCQEEYTDVNKIIYWEQRYEGNWSDEMCFVYEGERYVEFYNIYDYSKIEDPYKKYLEVKNENIVFNIRYEPSLFTIFYGPHTEDVYKVDNPYGMTLFTDGESLYIKEIELKNK